MVSGKWKPSIIYSLGLAPKCFGELRRHLLDLYGNAPAEKVLSQQLHRLIDEQIVRRTNYSSIPPKVVYSLTDRGKYLKGLLIQMAEFAENVQDGSVSFKYSSAVMKGKVKVTRQGDTNSIQNK